MTNNDPIEDQPQSAVDSLGEGPSPANAPRPSVMNDESGDNPDGSNRSQSEESGDGSKVLSRDELLAITRGMQGLLRATGNDEDADAFEGYATEIAMNAPMDQDLIEEEDEEPEEEYVVPDWGEALTDKSKIFLKPGATQTPILWEPYEKVTKEGGTDMVSVGYQRLNDHVFPGKKKHEQGLDLDIIENTFTKREWMVLVKPILQRYVNALQLRKYTKMSEEVRKEFEVEIKRTLKQVFKVDEIPTSKKVGKEVKDINILTDETQQQINGMVNAINTDPKILKAWIKEQLKKQDATEIKPAVRLGEVVRKEGKSYNDFREDTGVSTLEDEWGLELDGGKEKSKLDAKVDEMAYKIAQVGAQLLMLNAKHPEGLQGAHEKKADFKETDYMKFILGEIAKGAEKQLTNGRGVVNLIGDMGVGKNYVAEHFAAFTNRSFFYFPCARGMEPEDLAYHFEFKAGETLIVPSALGKGLTTPNSVILIDEPNALPPHVISALHGIADHNRAFVYNGMNFTAAPGVVIIFAMNPAGYEHVHDMPEALSDRTMGLDIYMDYPPLTRLDEISQLENLSDSERQDKLQEQADLDSIYKCDEVLILKGMIPELAGYSDTDFKNLWNVVLNKDHMDINAEMIGEVGKDVDKVTPLMGDLLKILMVLDMWRKGYKKGRMSRTISIRGAQAVVDKYLETKDIKKAFIGIFKRHQYKYGAGEFDYKNMEAMLTDAAFIEQELTEMLGA